jgi:aspartyl/glutamyl-tRNA(Asn/Gln) amidotransferase C subunit
VCEYTASMNLADIKKLALLARLRASDEELEAVGKDMDPILGYVAQVQNVSRANSSEVVLPPLINTSREDVVHTTTGEHTEVLLTAAPVRTGQYVQVKKIL